MSLFRPFTPAVARRHFLLHALSALGAGSLAPRLTAAPQEAPAASPSPSAGPGAASPGRIKVGQIGIQHGHAAGKMETLRRLADDFEVIGLTVSGNGRAGNPGRAFDGIPRFSQEALLALPGLQAVIVETDFPDACAAAHAAIRAGKHVHLDKPGALDHSAFRAMRQEAEDRSLVLQMGYMLRYNPAFQLLARAVKEGWLGTITEIDAMMGKKLDPAARRDLLRLPGGGIFELGCHLVDTVCSLMGAPEAVQCFSTPAGTDGFQDNQLAVLRYPRATAALRCNMADPFGGPRRRFSVTGTEGSLEIMPLESGKITLRLSTPHGSHGNGIHSLSLPIPPGRYDAELADFARAVHQAKPLPWTAAHDITVHATALRAGDVPL